MPISWSHLLSDNIILGLLSCTNQTRPVLHTPHQRVPYIKLMKMFKGIGLLNTSLLPGKPQEYGISCWYSAELSALRVYSWLLAQEVLTIVLLLHWLFCNRYKLLLLYLGFILHVMAAWASILDHASLSPPLDLSRTGQTYRSERMANVS